jgi:HlyD family secretion protein
MSVGRPLECTNFVQKKMTTRLSFRARRVRLGGSSHVITEISPRGVHPPATADLQPGRALRMNTLSRTMATVLCGASLLISCSQNNGKQMLFTGTMEATTVRVSAQTPGIVTALRFDEGASVRTGDTLASVETERLGLQADQGRAGVDEIEKQHHAAVAQRNASVINRDNIKLRYERFLSLLKTGAATQQNVDDLKTQLDAANEQLRGAQVSLEAMQEKKAQMQAGVKVIAKQIRDAIISAPLNGTVLVRYTEKGELLGVGSPVCELADVTHLWTKVYIAEKQLPFVKLGKKVKILIDGMPDRSFEGTVSWISDKAEFTPKTILTEETRTTLVYPAKITVENPDGLFKIGMPVSVRIDRES